MSYDILSARPPLPGCTAVSNHLIFRSPLTYVIIAIDNIQVNEQIILKTENAVMKGISVLTKG